MRPLPTPEILRPREGSMVEALAAEWLREKWREVAAGRKVARSIRELELSVRREWGWWRGTAIHELSSAGIRAWADALGSRGLAPATVRAELARFAGRAEWEIRYYGEELRRIGWALADPP
jgi:hypothetical protein